MSWFCKLSFLSTGIYIRARVTVLYAVYLAVGKKPTIHNP
jgi:hypothetical protein